MRSIALEAGLLAGVAMAAVAWAGQGAPPAVSPGGERSVGTVRDGCPTFSWGAVEGAAEYELVVYRVPAEATAVQPEEGRPVLHERLPGGVTGWTPALERCLEPGGRYAWSVRAQGIDEGSEWSEPRLFEVATAPSIAEVEKALSVLRGYLADGRDPAVVAPDLAGAAVPGFVARRERGRGSTGGSAEPEGIAPDAVAVLGSVPDATGVTYGVQGVSASTDDFSAGVSGESTATSGFAVGVVGNTASPDGAGMVAFNSATTGGGAGLFARTETPDGAAVDAENDSESGSGVGVLARTNAPDGAALRAAHRAGSGGPDVVLDGSEQGLTDTILTESGLDRPSGGVETFDFENSGGGTITLRAQGVEVVTTATDQDALGSLPCTGGQIPRFDAGLGQWVCSVESTSGGDITSVAAGAGLSGGGMEGDVTLDVATGGIVNAMLATDSVTADKIAANSVGASEIVEGEVQLRVTGVCSPGEALRGIQSDGSVECALLPDIPQITTISPTDSESETSIAIGSDGLPVIAYYDYGAAGLNVVKCNDSACAGGDETISTVDDPSVGRFASIAIGADGLPVISYQDLAASNLKVAKCNDPACSGGDETITTVDDTANDVGRFTSIAIGADGLPVIGYLDDTALSLKVAKCNDAACAGGDETITTVDDPANSVGYFASIAIGADGVPVVSYLDLSAIALKVAKCNDPACAGGDEAITTVDASGDVGYYSSLAIGADGLPVISYADITTGVLKVAKCNDLACAGGDETIRTVDSSMNVGSDTSIAIGADGLPVISYRDFGASTLKVAKCNDPACADGDTTITTVDDPENSVGTHTSIAIGADGLPVISYNDSPFSGVGSLRVAKCLRASCR